MLHVIREIQIQTDTILIAITRLRSESLTQLSIQKNWKGLILIHLYDLVVYMQKIKIMFIFMAKNWSILIQIHLKYLEIDMQKIRTLNFIKVRLTIEETIN